MIILLLWKFSIKLVVKIFVIFEVGLRWSIIFPSYSKSPHIRIIIWHLNTPKNKNLFSLEKKNRFLYKKATPILIVKILDCNIIVCVRNIWQKVIVYMFSLKIQTNFVWIFSRNLFSINHYVSVAQFFCQWLHYDNL